VLNIDSHGGKNKEQILMTINTFKKFCLKAGTKKADKIHDYYIKLEELLHETLNEECKELRDQLLISSNKIKDQKLEKELSIEKILLEQFPKNVQCIYYGLIDDTNENNETLIKFGNSNNLNERVKTHKRTYKNFRLINVLKVSNKCQIENDIKKSLFLNKHLRNIEIKNKNYTEILVINDKLTLNSIYDIIKLIIIKNEYNTDNYTKIVKEYNELEIENLKLKNNILFFNSERTKINKNDVKDSNEISNTKGSEKISKTENTKLNSNDEIKKLEEKIEYNKNYLNNHKYDKYICICGIVCRKRDKTRHMKTKIHNKNIIEKNLIE
jgi:hypothetical protein